MEGLTPDPRHRRLGARLLPEVPEQAARLPRRLVEHGQLGRGQPPVLGLTIRPLHPGRVPKSVAVGKCRGNPTAGQSDSIPCPGPPRLLRPYSRRHGSSKRPSDPAGRSIGDLRSRRLKRRRGGPAVEMSWSAGRACRRTGASPEPSSGTRMAARNDAPLIRTPARTRYPTTSPTPGRRMVTRSMKPITARRSEVRMRFFTPALYLRYNSADDAVADRAEAEWTSASRRVSTASGRPVGRDEFSGPRACRGPLPSRRRGPLLPGRHPRGARVSPVAAADRGALPAAKREELQRLLFPLGRHRPVPGTEALAAFRSPGHTGSTTRSTSPGASPPCSGIGSCGATAGRSRFLSMTRSSRRSRSAEPEAAIVSRRRA